MGEVLDLYGLDPVAERWVIVEEGVVLLETEDALFAQEVAAARGGSILSADAPDEAVQRWGDRSALT